MAINKGKKQKDYFAILNNALKRRVDLRQLKQKDMKIVAERTIDLMLANIEKGISPISGKRFPGYKNPANYPGKLKRQRPVNLYLTGDFLNNLDYEVNTGNNPQILIGFWDKESSLKELGHREGANGQLLRPIIPIGNERFSKRLQVEIDKTFLKVLDGALG